MTTGTWLFALLLASETIGLGGDGQRPEPSTTTRPSPPGESRRQPELVSLLGGPLFATPSGDLKKLEAALAGARAEMADHPDDPDKAVWVGRRLGYLWRMNEAIGVFSAGIEKWPDYAPLYRHRGHRHISVRRFDEAVADLEKAARLIEGQPEEVEPDGMPNAANIPLTTTPFNVWYHLGLARYLKGDFQGALRAYQETMKYSRRYEDNLVATTHWMYMTLRRLGREQEAAALLEPIGPDMKIMENAAYHRLTLMYKGLNKPEELLEARDAGDLDRATTGYGVGNWYYYNGQTRRAAEVWRQVVAGPNWPAFGFIAAEVELARSSSHPR